MVLLTHIHPPALVNLILVCLWHSCPLHRLKEADEVDVTAAVAVAPHVPEAEEGKELCLHSSLFLHLTDHSSGQVFPWGGVGGYTVDWRSVLTAVLNNSIYTRETVEIDVGTNAQRRYC